MQHRIQYLCFALLASCVGFAPQPLGAGEEARSEPSQHVDSPSTTANLLEARVRDAWTAFKNKDKDGYAEFLADDFQAVEADGDGERPKPRILREVEHSMYTDFLLQLFQVQQLGPNYAFVTYESTIQFPQGSATRYRRVFVGELWTKQRAQWKMMRYQETPVR